ncbi:MAG TPA: site-specific integrase [Candidatus Bathyarchaeia archaeon]|nr:site-specific integrase [Candidatus Bathyarchaeia archaeon]
MNTYEPFRIPLANPCRRTQRKTASPTKLALLVMAGLPKASIDLTNPSPVVNLLVEMKKNGMSDYTIESTNKALMMLRKTADLNDPEQVKAVIAEKNVSTGFKANICQAYNRFCDFYGIYWRRPKYSTEAQPIKVPTAEKLEMFIAKAGRLMSMKLRLSKEAGLRPIELCRLRVKDVDLDQKLVYPTTAKHGAARALKISENLSFALADHIHRENLSTESKLFDITPRSYSKLFRIMRNALADKLHDPTMKSIRLYDFRHYFATNDFRKYKNLMHTKQQLGHKSIRNTEIYVHFIDTLSEDFVCNTATTIDEAKKLIEAGFTYVDTMDGIKLYRKPK